MCFDTKTLESTDWVSSELLKVDATQTMPTQTRRCPSTYRFRSNSHCPSGLRQPIEEVEWTTLRTNYFRRGKLLFGLM